MKMRRVSGQIEAGCASRLAVVLAAVADAPARSWPRSSRRPSSRPNRLRVSSRPTACRSRSSCRRRRSVIAAYAVAWVARVWLSVDDLAASRRASNASSPTSGGEWTQAHDGELLPHDVGALHLHPFSAARRRRHRLDPGVAGCAGRLRGGVEAARGTGAEEGAGVADSGLGVRGPGRGRVRGPRPACRAEARRAARARFGDFGALPRCSFRLSRKGANP